MKTIEEQFGLETKKKMGWMGKECKFFAHTHHKGTDICLKGCKGNKTMINRYDSCYDQERDYRWECNCFTPK